MSSDVHAEPIVPPGVRPSATTILSPESSRMIARHWCGLARVETADAYVQHLRTETFPQLGALAGFVSASILRRPAAEGVEFLVVTVWESLDAIRTFAGEHVHVAVVPDVVRGMLLQYDETAVHYDVLETFSPSPRVG